jgi:hypothetical protein
MRSGFRYSLRVLLAGVGVIALIIAVSQAYVGNLQRKASAVRALQRSNVSLIDHNWVLDENGWLDSDANDIERHSESDLALARFATDVIEIDMSTFLCVDSNANLASHLNLLSEFPKLKRLNCDSNDMVDMNDSMIHSMIEALGSQCSVIEELSLNYNSMTDDSLNAISRWPALRKLSLAYSKSIGDAGIAHLAKCNRLTELDVSGTQISGRCFRHFETSTSLRWVDVSDTHVSDASLMNLMKIRSLREVWIFNTQVTDDAIQEFQSLRPDVDIRR